MAAPVIPPLGTGEYTLEVLRGLTTGNDLLSCNSGGQVDLWFERDASGRQVWSFESAGLDSGFFRIRVKGGVNAPDSVYLTGQGPGAVILAPESNAIHQQWSLEAVDIPDRPNTYNLINRICEAGDSEFMSCVPDGSYIDRWNVDDGSGRQQWQLQGLPLPPT
jgi:hypothetical protein